jgi:hypothetical protein
MIRRSGWQSHENGSRSPKSTFREPTGAMLFLEDVGRFTFGGADRSGCIDEGKLRSTA